MEIGVEDIFRFLFINFDCVLMRFWKKIIFIYVENLISLKVDNWLRRF